MNQFNSYNKTQKEFMNFNDFADFGIKQTILDAVATMGFTTPTPVQEQTVPLFLSKADILVQAPTGTGKTASFAIPIINSIDVESKDIQAVILCPTRELTLQISEEMKKIGANCKELRILSVFGGQNIERQLAGIRKKPQIIVGTTGRVMDHLKRRTLKLENVKTIVLDEADEMLDMGFREDIDFILKKMNRDVQVLLFSATIPKEILDISKKYQNEPLTVKTTCEGNDIPPIKQYLLNLNEDNKFEALQKIINENDYHNVLIFVNTKLRADELNNKLNDKFYISMALHGDLKQRERDKVMKSFREHQINILVATDVAARGIDVKNIEAIFNYDVPLDEEFYVHRIGRTARASASGVAYTFATGREKQKVTYCEKAAGARMELLEIEGLTQKASGKARKDFGLPTTRFFVNVGEKDGATQQKLASFVTSNTHITADDIYDVKLKDIYGFVEVDSKFNDEMLGLNGAKCFRRKLAVEISEDKKQTTNGQSQERQSRKEQPRKSGGSRNYGGGERKERTGEYKPRTSNGKNFGGREEGYSASKEGGKRTYSSSKSAPRNFDRNAQDNEFANKNFSDQKYSTKKTSDRNYGDKKYSDKKYQDGDNKENRSQEGRNLEFSKSERNYGKPRYDGKSNSESKREYKPKREYAQKQGDNFDGAKPKREYKPRQGENFDGSKPKREYKPRQNDSFDGAKPKREYKPRQGEDIGSIRPKRQDNKKTYNNNGDSKFERSEGRKESPKNAKSDYNPKSDYKKGGKDGGRPSRSNNDAPKNKSDKKKNFYSA